MFKRRRVISIPLACFLSAAATTTSLADVADLVIRNANVLQCDDPLSRCQAIAVKQGRIVALGSNEQVLAWIDDQRTVVIDAQSQTLTPGLTDSHLHFAELGRSLQILDLSQARSWPEIVEQVRQASLSAPPGSWIEGRGWHQSKWNSTPRLHVDGYPHHQSMSAAVPDHPVILTHASGHALFANAAAMELAGVDEETPDPNGGVILKDQSGRPIGVFLENAGGRILRAAARLTRDRTDQERLEQLHGRVTLAGEACLRHGITSVHDAGTSFSDARLLRQLAESGKLPVRMNVMIRAGVPALDRQMKSARWIGIGEGFLTVRSVKVAVDGALGSHGAWLLQPYSDLPEQRGLNTVGLDELERTAILCKEHQWQLCVHAIGDRANREVLDIYQRVLGSDVDKDHRWRIEHAQHLDVEDIPRFAELHVIPAMQANHCTSDASFVPTRLGQRRSAQGAYVWRSLIDAGSIIPNGTDAPVEPIDPRVSLHAAVTRELPGGETFYPKQSMTRAEGLLSYTLWPARAGFRDHDLGSIEIGKLADFVLWDTDLLTCPPSAIRSAVVRRVWIGGQEQTIP